MFCNHKDHERKENGQFSFVTTLKTDIQNDCRKHGRDQRSACW